MFYVSRKFGAPERHKFIRDKHQLTCRFAVADIPLNAAKEAEALLSGHWGLRKDGGTLFNDQIPSLEGSRALTPHESGDRDGPVGETFSLALRGRIVL
jgi:hypothetical protein